MQEGRTLPAFQPMTSECDREDVESERKFFDKFYLERRGREDPREAQWVRRAVEPRSRPLDYWEYTFRLLGDLSGKRVLEIGCGGGWLTRMLAAKGALVSAIDISEEACISTRRELEQNGFSFETICTMDAHHLEFPAGSFDAVLVAGVLHHVNLRKVLIEVLRVLKRGGQIIGYEPMRYGSLALRLRRLYLNFRDIQEHDHTDHEEALTNAELALFYDLFPQGFARKFNFVAKTNQLKNRFGTFAELLRWTDYILLWAVPPLRRYCTCVVFCFQK